MAREDAVRELFFAVFIVVLGKCLADICTPPENISMITKAFYFLWGATEAIKPGLLMGYFLLHSVFF